MKSPIYLFLALIFLMSCSSKEQVNDPATPSDAVLGKLEHGFELNPAVQEKFDEGLLLLHNFEYDDGDADQ